MQTSHLPVSGPGLLVLIMLISQTVTGQQVTGTYVTTGTDPSIFAVDPLYLNPATARGAVGLFTNPAALARIDNFELGFAVGFTHRNKASFTTEILEGTEEFESVNLKSEIEIKERGGISALAIGKKLGKFSVGVGYEQPRRAGLLVSASGKARMNFRFDLDQPITREIFTDLPVDSIPMQWSIDAQTMLELNSRPAEIYVSSLPLFLAAAYRLGPLSLGVGAKYISISSSQAVAGLSANLQASADIVGTPYGSDPATGLPWQGSVNARVQLNDRPFDAEYQLGVKGRRFAISVGANIDLKLLKLGFTLERGIPSRLTGSYRVKVLTTNGPPLKPEIRNVTINVANLPQVQGSADLYLQDFSKDSVSVSASEELRLGGYTGVSGGIHFLIFGLFAGAEIPTESLDFGSAYFGGYIDLPIFYTPIRIRTGIIQRTGFFMTETEDVIPFYTVADVVAGTSIKLGLTGLVPALKEPVVLQFGLRTSIFPLAFQFIKDDMENVTDKRLPSVTDALTMNFGIRFSL